MKVNSIKYSQTLVLLASLIGMVSGTFAYGKTSRPFVPFQKIKSTGPLRSALMIVPIAIDYRARKSVSLIIF